MYFTSYIRSLTMVMTVIFSVFSLLQTTIFISLASAKALKGDTYYTYTSSEPPTLNPITSQDMSASIIQNYIIESLMTRDKDSYEWVPNLAEKITPNKDGTEYVVDLRPGLTFSDGKPLTATDVKFSFDVVFDEDYNAVHKQPYFEGIKNVEVLNPLKLRFVVKKPYFRNFDTIAGLDVVPKHFYNKGNKKHKNKTLLGSGPYLLDRYDQGKRIILKRNPKWWGANLPQFQEEYNFDRISFRFVNEEQIKLEMLKKNKLDMITLTAEAYKKKTDDPKFGTELEKLKVQNKSPKGYNFIAWNFKNKFFQDKRTRQALAHLLNRELMNEKFKFNMAELATGPWAADSIYANDKIEPIDFNPIVAANLLAEAGWKDTNKDGVLDKAFPGQKERVKFEFTLLNPSKDMEKYWTIYKQDLAKAGIIMQIKYLDWTSFTKLLDEQKFDAVYLGWSGGAVDLDPKQIWHSSSASKGGSNFISYKNPQVDKLIDQARAQFKRSDRIKILKKVYKLIADDAPYAFLFYPKYILYAHQKSIGKPKDTFQYTLGTDYWWRKTK